MNFDKAEYMHECIVGPSHCVRLQHAVQTSQLPRVPALAALNFVCVGGMPVWSPRIRRNVDKNARPFFLVGDFRFGNALLKHMPEEASDLANVQEYLAVEKDLINEKNDQALFDLCRASIWSHIENYPGSKYLFWDLSIREYENRTSGKYQESGDYQHPIWNLNPVLAEFGSAAVDSRDMLECGGRMYVDSSGHPSLIGWLYIVRHLRGAASNLHAMIEAFDRNLMATMASLFGGRKVLITGDSKFTRILERYIAAGLFHLPIGSSVMSVQRAIDADGYDECLYFPSTTTQKLSADEISMRLVNVQHVKKRLMPAGRNVSVLFYDNWALESISRRKDYHNAYICEHMSGRTKNVEDVVCGPVQRYRITDSNDYFECMIELNNTLLPTTFGLMEILGRAVSGFDHAKILSCYHSLLGSIEEEASK